MLSEKYDRGEIRIVTEQARYPLPSIPTMIQSGNYKLNPDFQRRHRWDGEKQSRLIESFIMNVPIPPIFLYEDRYSHYEVMDGLQRLTAIQDFYENKLRLTGLKQWSELNGRTYESLPPQVQHGIDRRYLSSIILLHETAKTPAEAQHLKQLVFERLNSGGVKLEAQESRNAIYDGPMNRLCIQLARNHDLCATWGIPAPDPGEEEGKPPNSKRLAHPAFRTMKDVELVLRFFAYRQRLENQSGALEDFLDEYLKKSNLFPDRTLLHLANLFRHTILLARTVWEEKAFWLHRLRNEEWNWFKRPTTVVYDPLMFALSHRLEHTNTFMTKKKILQKSIAEFYKQNYDQFEGRYTNISNMHDRNRLFIAFLDSHIF
jgi:hypothetical protein